MTTKYDAIIIGAGMSGLAAGIRLAMFDKKVVVLEKHNISGGLNSYFRRRIPTTKQLFEFDVGLHALTNFAKKGERRKPLTKLLKQLRIPYESLKLKEQTHSLIKFKSACLKFSNDFELLKSEISNVFPNEIDSFIKFVAYIEKYNEVDLNAPYTPARSVLDLYFKEELLKEMLVAPLLIYGSAWENDMDFSQFVIMFKSLYLEGFSRPEGGVRTIINLLLKRLEEVGGEVRYNSAVTSIECGENVKGVLLKNGEFLESTKIFSSAGLPETYSIVNRKELIQSSPRTGKLSFMETIIITEDKTFLKNYDPTIVFYNSSDKYRYAKSSSFYDDSSAVFCLPDNYERENQKGHGTIRATYMANFDLWNELNREKYLEMKSKVLTSVKTLTNKILSHSVEPIFTDVFSPTTIKRYTNHFDGTVYGSVDKLKNGKSDIDGLYIIGTDQGFLGIAGSMLSGISMANLYGLME
jgi:phytoene dehydrogenase-like protein